MKKIILTVVAMMAVATTTFAEDNSNATKDIEKAQYIINFNNDRIAACLRLDADQKADMEYVHKDFSRDMEKAFRTKSEKRQKVTKRAIYRDLANMRAILNEQQYSRYRTLLQVTLTNRGIEL